MSQAAGIGPTVASPRRVAFATWTTERLDHLVETDGPRARPVSSRRGSGRTPAGQFQPTLVGSHPVRHRPGSNTSSGLKSRWTRPPRMSGLKSRCTSPHPRPELLVDLASMPRVHLLAQFRVDGRSEPDRARYALLCRAATFTSPAAPFPPAGDLRSPDR